MRHYKFKFKTVSNDSTAGVNGTIIRLDTIADDDNEAWSIINEQLAGGAICYEFLSLVIKVKKK